MRIRLISDSAFVRTALGRGMEDALPYAQVEASPPPANDLPRVGDHPCDLLVIDYDLGTGINGIDWCRRHCRGAPAILITSHDPVPLRRQAFAAGFTAVIGKNTHLAEQLAAEVLTLCANHTAHSATA